jgi:fido (protein-threonine AMPylation protein)
MNPQPLGCPDWEYENHPQRASVAHNIAAVFLKPLARGRIDTMAIAADSRSIHGEVFRDVAPLGYPHFAGHYRGEHLDCLRYYSVGVPGDSRVGAPPSAVFFLMSEIGKKVRAAIIALDANVALTNQERLRYLSALVCHALVAFFTVHPYANGNGHAGRIIVWSIMGRYGHFSRRWTIDPRPPDPPYTTLITEYRSGNRTPLEEYIIEMFVPAS